MNKLLVLAACAAALPLTGCGGVSEMTKEQVARSETLVKQAQMALGTSEAGAVELQQAKEHMSQAQQALEKKDDKQAQRLAVMAELDAQLAVAKAQSSVARKAADDLLASIQTLKEEAARSGTTR
jgi:hypothetical protein